uniref:NET domain-containing protein n=1 Tax=Aegilops tauschii TaxID=37682 RepID=R7WGA1_AEGTA
MEIAYPYGGELTRKHGFVTAEPFDAKTGIMSGPKRAREMEILRQRFQAELVAVRGLLHKAAAVLAPASSPSAPRVKKSRPRFLAEEPPAKKRKLLKKHSCATRPGEIEIDLHAMDDAAVVELQEQVDKFARQRRSNPSPQERDQDGPKVMAQEEEEEDEEVDICGGVSPLAIVPQPLPQERHQDGPKAMAQEEEEDVDICGGVSPLPIVEDETASASPSSSVSSSDTDSSDSDSDTDPGSSDLGSEHSGGSDSDSDSDEIVDSLAPPTCEQLARALERQRKEATSRAREKARQEVLQMEKTAMPDDTLHPEDLKRLGIDEYNTAKPNNLLRQIGLYLKLDDDRKHHHHHHHHHQIFEEDLEEGEILS